MNATQTPPADKPEVKTLDVFEYTSTPSGVDASKVIDKPGFKRAWEAIVTAAEGFIPGARQVASATADGANACVALREVIARGDNGAPDWAGNTTTYAEVWRTYLNNALGVGTGAVTLQEVDAYRSRVASYMSDHQLIAKAQLRYAAKNDSKAGFTAAEVDALEAKGNDGKPSAKMTAALKRSDATQVGKDGKTALNGHKAEQRLQVFGRKPKKAPTRVQSQNASESTPARAWEVIAAEVEQGKLALPTAADNAHKVVSLLIGQIIGPKGDKVPEGAEGRAEALAIIGKIGAACDAACSLFAEGSKTSKDEVIALLWSEKASN